MLQPDRLLTALCEADVRFVIVGGLAAVAQGSTYPTVDVDICYDRKVDNYERLSRALKPLNPRLRGAPPGLPFAFDALTIKAGLNFTLITDEGDLDLLGEVSGLGDFGAVLNYVDEVELYGHRLRVLGLEGLILSKQACGRGKDLRIIPELKALQALRVQSKEE